MQSRTHTLIVENEPGIAELSRFTLIDVDSRAGSPTE